MGIIVGLLNAFSTAFTSVFLKKLSGTSPNFLTWVRVASALPALLIIVAVFVPWSLPQKEFWALVIFVITPLEIALAWLGTRALQLSPISIIAPLASLTSIFLIPVGFLILGELPTLLGFGGVLAIVLGSFLIGHRGGEPFMRGLKNVFKEKGSYLASAGAFLASVAISVTKVSFAYAPPLLSALYINLVLAIVLLPFLFIQSPEPLRKHSKALAGVGLTAGLGTALHFIGLALLPAVYYISIKRLSVVIDVFLGRVFFHEDHIRERFFGAVLMFAGIVLIAVG